MKNQEQEEIEDQQEVPEKSEQAPKVAKAELARRDRVVKTSRALFNAIDFLLNAPQNTCPYVNKNNINTIETVCDIVYDEALPDVCRFDMYRVHEEGKHKQPAIILIHGGGFSAGDKKYRRGQAQFFALDGYTVFVVNYGLSPDYVFPQPINHLINAANHIYANAAKYNIDKKRIIVAGDSAGAYYASMLAGCNGSDVFEETVGATLNFDIFGALLVCGLYDIQTVLSTRVPFDVDDGVLLSFMGISRNDFFSYEYSDRCMPFAYINEKFPPTFLIFSDYDVFCKGQGDVMIEKLAEYGVYFEYYKARHSTSNHCFSLNWRGEDAAAANELMRSFVRRLCSGKIKLSK